MNDSYFSVRMHASRTSRHLSGGERLVPGDQVEHASVELLSRAMVTLPDSVKLNVEEIDFNQVVFGSIPEVILMPPVTYQQARADAVATLIKAGVTEQSAKTAVEIIAAGASSDGHAMRGAMLIDAHSGARLEPDHERGVRATHFDLLGETALSLKALLQSKDLCHIRTREALVLSAKVLAAPGVIAELCWSDAPDYTAGYVSSTKTGYCRFSALKPAGDERGGRAFFVNPGCNLAETISFLELTPFLVNRHAGVSSQDVML